MLLPRFRDAPLDLLEPPLLVRGLAVFGRPVDSGLAELLSGRADREPLTLGRRLKKSLLPARLPVLRLVSVMLRDLEVGEVERSTEDVVDVDGRLRERTVVELPERCPVTVRPGPTPVRRSVVPALERVRETAGEVGVRFKEPDGEVGAVRALVSAEVFLLRSGTCIGSVVTAREPEPFPALRKTLPRVVASRPVVRLEFDSKAPTADRRLAARVMAAGPTARAPSPRSRTAPVSRSRA